MATPLRRDRERQARREDILAAAETVFSQRGYEGTSMEEVARMAQFTKRTVYQYFNSKEDLLFAVVLRLRERLFARLQAALDAGGTGRARIQRAARAYYDFYGDFPDLLRLVNASGYVRAEGGKSPHYQELMKLGAEMFAGFAKVVALGQSDGSIRTDLDARTGACSVAFLLTGFFSLLADSGPAFTGLLNLEQRDFVATTLGLIDDALCPLPTTSEEQSTAADCPGKRKTP